MDLTGKRALIAASSRGLGRAVAAALVESGARVMVSGRDGETVGRTVSELNQSTASAIGIPADVSEPADVRRLVQETVQHFGGIDILIVNAGGPKPGGFFELQDGDWEGAFQLTLMSAIRLIRESLPHFPEGGGRIVAIVSSSVRQPIEHLTLSNVTRPAVSALVKDLSQQLGSRNLLINAVAPGRFDTDRVRQNDQDRAARKGITADEERAAAVAHIPLGRYGDPMELAHVIRFLVSDENTYLTGQTLLVDGGLVKSL